MTTTAQTPISTQAEQRYRAAIMKVLADGSPLVAGDIRARTGVEWYRLKILLNKLVEEKTLKREVRENGRGVLYSLQ